MVIELSHGKEEDCVKADGMVVSNVVWISN